MREEDRKVDELLAMSQKELSRLDVMKQLEAKRLKQKEAAQMLGLGVRQVKRLLRAYRGSGALGWCPSTAGMPATTNWTRRL